MTRILLYNVIIDKDTQAAEAALLKLTGLRKFYDHLQSDREKEDFLKHMRKYINIWLPDCPFEVSTTNRYTIMTQEAATTARRLIKKGETIKYLSGNLVAMTSEEEQDLDLTRRDFSIVMSTRKKTPSLFLGPARFANHDCDANARLVTKGPGGMQVVAVKNISIDEEITVTYGEDYFGIDNCECLCGTCEREGRNGWAPVSRSADGTPSSTGTPIAEDSEPGNGLYSFRKKRKYGSTSNLPSESTTPDAENTSPKRRKFSFTKSTTMSDSDGKNSLVVPTPGKRRYKSSALRREVLLDDQASASANQQLLLEQGMQTPETPSSAISRNRFAEDLSSQIKAALKGSDYIGGQVQISQKDFESLPSIITNSDAILDNVTSSKSTLPSIENLESAFPEAPITPTQIKIEESPISLISSDVDSIFDHEKTSSSAATTPSLDPSTSKKRKFDTETPEFKYDSDSDLSELSNSETFDDINIAIIRLPKPKRRKYNSNRTSRSLLPTIEIPTTRTTGDYIRTSLLLGEPLSKWVDCKTCSAVWVQSNGYYTRKECPRCERHSKLYGYQWPKTDKARGDQEERVLDHRTVHRFLNPKEELAVKKKGRGCRGGSGSGSAAEGRSESVKSEVVVGSEDFEFEDKGAKFWRKKRGKKRGRKTKEAVKVEMEG